MTGYACRAMAFAWMIGTATMAVAAPRATIDTGALQGTEAEGVVSYKGIPFAAPPVGPLRWRAPQPVAAWSGVRDASAYGHDCMQKPFPSDAAPLGTAPAEDCLYANVWRPAGAKRNLPVMVWIYGGGFVNGGASPPTYSGAELAKRGIVVVSFNYRVGRFGFFAHPGLTRENGDGGQLADFAYMDQIAALKWVQRNVAAFGGDPGEVTIIGESAGGISVHTLIASPVAKGLFERAVIQSGGGPRVLPRETLSQAEATGMAFAASKGIAADDPQAVAKLRALSPNDVVSGLNLESIFAPAPGPRTFSPPIEQAPFPSDAMAVYASGAFARVPVMVGATSDDAGGPDGVMIQGATQVASALSGKGVPVYHYRFSYVADSARTPETKGAAHATDIPFFFDTQAIKYGAATTAKDNAAGKVASSYLVNFVKSGDPNGPGLPRWKPYTDADPSMLDLAADGTAKPGTVAAPR
ncbi:carboxylesterase/lipase family protein [Sphingomonas oryzagri]